MTDTIQLRIQNPYNNAGQATVNGFDNNLPVDNPTVEDLARTMTSSFDAARISFPQAAASEGASEPLFGTHIREAVAIVKDWVKPR